MRHMSNLQAALDAERNAEIRNAPDGAINWSRSIGTGGRDPSERVVKIAGMRSLTGSTNATCDCRPPIALGVSRVLAPFVARVIIANPLQVKAIAQAHTQSISIRAAFLLRPADVILVRR